MKRPTWRKGWWRRENPFLWFVLFCRLLLLLFSMTLLFSTSCSSISRALQKKENNDGKKEKSQEWLRRTTKFLVSDVLTYLVVEAVGGSFCMYHFLKRYKNYILFIAIYTYSADVLCFQFYVQIPSRFTGYYLMFYVDQNWSKSGYGS